MTIERQEPSSLVSHALTFYAGNWSKQVIIQAITFVAVVSIALAADASGVGVGIVVLLAVSLTVTLLLVLPLLLALQKLYSLRNGSATIALNDRELGQTHPVTHGSPNVDDRAHSVTHESPNVDDRAHSVTHESPNVDDRSRPVVHASPNVNDESIEVAPIEDRPFGPRLIGRSPVMQKLFAVTKRVAPTDASVLITGASGTGKGLLARTIHELSRRRDAAFVEINCSAIPETLIESELFGHQRGAFTGAHKNRLSLFEEASGGTLFIDEVEALNPSVQAKLLRVIQEKTVRRIGGRAQIAVDVRIISATNFDLAQAVAEGSFRPDLYYRLRVLPIYMPELSMRGDDLRLLVEHFLRMKSEKTGQSMKKFTAEAMRALYEYPWPGNVRELENTIEFALAIGLENELGVADLPPEILSSPRQVNPDDFREVLQAYMNDTVALAEIEKRYILSVLQQFGGNQARAAAALGIDRSKLYRRLKQYKTVLANFLEIGQAKPETQAMPPIPKTGEASSEMHDMPPISRTGEANPEMQVMPPISKTSDQANPEKRAKTG